VAEIESEDQLLTAALCKLDPRLIPLPTVLQLSTGTIVRLVSFSSKLVGVCGIESEVDDVRPDHSLVGVEDREGQIEAAELLLGAWGGRESEGLRAPDLLKSLWRLRTLNGLRAGRLAREGESEQGGVGDVDPIEPRRSASRAP
jgi:hypothetical protein